MKNITFILCLLLTMNICVATQYSSTLDKLENNIFGFTYMDTDEARITRLEQSIYGEGKSGNINTRISNLDKDMSANEIGKEIKPKEDTFADEEIYTPEDRMARESVAPAGANVDYPAVNALEKEVFNQEYKNKDLTTRLSDLESKTFGKSYPEDDFSSRVERLKSKINPKVAQKNYSDSGIIPYNDGYILDEYSAPDFDYESYNARNSHPGKVNLASVERSMYKKSFTKEELDSRLTRLENTMFGTTFSSDTQQQRINRIASAYKASKSSGKYDSNKFTQNIAAATQIGMLILMILACVL